MIREELRRHLLPFFALLRLETTAIDRFDPSPAAAWRALHLFWIILPLRLFASWASEYIILQDNLAEYLVIRSTQLTVALFAPLPLVWFYCRAQDCARRFPLFVTTYIWLALFWAVFSAAASMATFDMTMELGTIKAIGTTLFFVGYASSSYFAWLSLRCNAFTAIGVATAIGFIVAVTSDVSGIMLFGTPRPLIGE